MADIEPDDGFLTRWSRRKAAVREGQPVPPVATTTPAPATPPTQTVPQQPAVPHTAAAPGEATALATPVPPDAPPPPTLDDAARLTPASDFRRFVTPEVTADVRNAALKRLFTDPHFNVMDGLDTYIEDFGKPDPLPLGMLRKMVQAEGLNLFANESPPRAEASAAVLPPDPEEPADEDPALRLQPHDATGPPGVEPGLGEGVRGQP